MFCPNLSDPKIKEQFTRLENLHPDFAYYLWDKYEGEVPAKYYNLYQLQPKTDVDKNIEELDGYLVDFISKFGFKAEELDTLKNRIGVDAIGVTDVINKLILFAKDRNITTLPEEVAHAAVMLMGPSHPAIFELMGNIQDWEKYESIKKQYLPIYKNELQVEIEAVGQLISEAIVSNYKVVGIKPNILKRAIKQIREFINNLFSNPKTQSEFDKIKKVADKVALNILKGNYNYISNAVPSGVKLDYDLAVSQNPLAQQIIQTFNSVGNALTGSLALAAQGETVYRDPNELIHDLDFIVHNNLEYRKTKHLVDKMGGVPIHFGWQNVGDSKITHTFMIPASGFKITNVTREWAGRNYIKDFDLVDSKGNIVEVTPTNAMVVDFFVNENLPNPGLKFTRFQDIYAGKLSLSTFGANERFFRRAKDQKDYILSTPTEFYPPSEAFTYYQLPSTQGKEGVSELFESNPELANAVYEALGFENKLKTSLGKELEYKDAYVSVSRLKDFKQYQVLDEKGNDIGSVVIEYRGDKTVILHPKLNISGKGYGKDLYKFVSNKFGVEIQEWNEAGISKSDSAKAMWDSLEKEGTAKRIIGEEQGDNFRVLKYINQITPQQKQQAQQLYSQYLDSIFPDSKVEEMDNNLYISVLNDLKSQKIIDKQCS